MVVVHHSPLADNQRPRGSTALIAAADIAIAVDRAGEQRVAKLMKNRDGEADTKLAFKLNSLVVGYDKKQREITSCIVEETEPPKIEPRAERLTANQQTMLMLLEESMPNGLSSEEWNDRARAAELNCIRRPANLTDWKKELKRKGRCRETQGRWFVTDR